HKNRLSALKERLVSFKRLPSLRLVGVEACNWLTTHSQQHYPPNAAAQPLPHARAASASPGRAAGPPPSDSSPRHGQRNELVHAARHKHPLYPAGRRLPHKLPGLHRCSCASKRLWSAAPISPHPCGSHAKQHLSPPDVLVRAAAATSARHPHYPPA